MVTSAVTSAAEQGDLTAGDNEGLNLSLKVVPQMLGLNEVGRRRPKSNDGPLENPRRRDRQDQRGRDLE